MDYNEAKKNEPTEELCSKRTTVDVVGKRCVYVNSHRVAGGKPYVAENLPQHEFNISVRDALDAFSFDELEAYIKEKKARLKYWSDFRANKEAAE